MKLGHAPKRCPSFTLHPALAPHQLWDSEEEILLWTLYSKQTCFHSILQWPAGQAWPAFLLGTSLPLTVALPVPGQSDHWRHLVGAQTEQTPAEGLFRQPSLLRLLPQPSAPSPPPHVLLAVGSGWWLCLSNLGPCLRRGSNNSGRNCPNYCCPFELDICLMTADGNLIQPACGVAEEPASQQWLCRVGGAPGLGPWLLQEESPPYLNGTETCPTNAQSINKCPLSVCCVQGSSS